MKIDYSEISSLLLENDNFIIISHVRPDGDAIGSSIGLLNALLDNGKKAVAYFDDQLPVNYQNLVTSDKVIIDKKPLDYSEYNICLCLDVSSTSRIAFGESFEISQLPIPLVNIDHHPDNNIPGSSNLVDSKSAATSQIVFELCKLAGFKVSDRTATALMAGVIMDTGCFRFDNTSPDVLICASELLASGADHHQIIGDVYFSKPMNHVLFESELIIDRLKTAFGGRYAWIYIPEDVISKHNIDLKNSEGLIDKVREIAGVEVAALLHRIGDRFKVSLRSKRLDYSVGSIARSLGGGGHELAAGASIKTDDYKQAEKILLEQVEGILK